MIKGRSGFKDKDIFIFLKRKVKQVQGAGLASINIDDTWENLYSTVAIFGIQSCNLKLPVA
jgi:hypothetical protein